jgi:hypothetical protein
MDLVVFENDKPYVIDEFRQGRFDYIELASDVAETKFFRFLFDKDVVRRLAAEYPTPRQRHHVPLWMHVSSQMSMRLHGSHSFHSYPLIIRSGGLLDALGPELARREVDPETGRLSIWCAGFNARNVYPRSTPCDQDTLRKVAKDTDPEALEAWYNGAVPRLYGELGAYDSAGVFVGDGSYLFVPDNPRYEGSMRLFFDEHNHPVDPKREAKMTKAQRARCRWRRCYKAVFLLHTDWAGERFVVAGLRVLRANESEAPALWALVEGFVGAVGRGVIKVLVVDRGFINGPQIGHLKCDLDIDVVIPVRSNMAILEDARGLARLGAKWEEYHPSSRGPLEPPKPQPAALRKREQARQKTVARQRAKARREHPPDPSKLLQRTLVTKLDDLATWEDCPVPLAGVLSRDLYADGHEQTWMLVTTARGWSASHTRDHYRLRTDIEERHRQVKCFWDLTRFHSTAWSVVVNQAVFVALTYSLLQIHLLAHGHQELNRRTWPTAHRLLPDADRVIIYRQEHFAFFTLLEHTALTLSLEDKARRKALAKARRLLNGDLPT